MSTYNTPAAEVEIDEVLVRSLLQSQFPELARLDLTVLANGWDNVLFRLGDAMTVRMPRREVAAQLVLNEQRWLPLLDAQLPLPIPVPLRAGVPSPQYPWAWSVLAYVVGEAAADATYDEDRVAMALGEFLAALHTPAPADAPLNLFRGVPLSDRDAVSVERIAALANTVDVDAVACVWRNAVEVPIWSGEPVWIHGDLHPANVVVHRGDVAAVIDFGDITSGDPATDLSAGWMFFGPEARRIFRNAYGNDDADLWARARGNALAHSLAVLTSSGDSPRMQAIGERTLTAVLADR